MQRFIRLCANCFCISIFMKIPQPTGVQDLRGIIVTESKVWSSDRAHPIKDNLLCFTGFFNQLRSDYRAKGNQSPTQTLLCAGVNLPGPPVDYTTAFTDPQADRDDAILLASIQSLLLTCSGDGCASADAGRLGLVRHSSGCSIWWDQAGRSGWPKSPVLSILYQAQHSSVQKNFDSLLQSRQLVQSCGGRVSRSTAGKIKRGSRRAGCTRWCTGTILVSVIAAEELAVDA